MGRRHRKLVRLEISWVLMLKTENRVMSNNLIGSLPPPYPNAAQALQKVSSNAELLAQIKENKSVSEAQSKSNSSVDPAGNSAENGKSGGFQNPQSNSTSGVDLKV